MKEVSAYLDFFHNIQQCLVCKLCNSLSN